MLAFRQTVPRQRRIGVVLGMVPIVKQQKIVQTPVVTRRPSRVLIVAMQVAQHESANEPRHINGHEEHWSARRYDDPQEQHERYLNNRLAGERQPTMSTRVVRQVAVTPPCVRESEQQTQVGREQDIGGPSSKEWLVNEIMRDGVRIPPEP